MAFLLWNAAIVTLQFLLTYDGNGVSTVKQTLPTNYRNCSQISEQEHHNALSIVFQKVQIQSQKTFTKSIY
jgi:hypothetical protein